jgi:predicted subunit of tRNA(5-methylaminomethyl-2-thiouridylate) methyltransferase
MRLAHRFKAHVKALEGLAQKHYDITVAASTRTADSIRTASDAHQQALEQASRQGAAWVHACITA